MNKNNIFDKLDKAPVSAPTKHEISVFNKVQKKKSTGQYRLTRYDPLHGKILLSIPFSLRRMLEKEATENGVDFEQYIISKLER